jgi:hypothetical protein
MEMESQKPEKLMIAVNDGRILVTGNRRGLLGLAEICRQLAALPETRDASRKLGNHYHYAEFMNNAEPGSVEMEVLYDPEM